jgi:hypothetical protein
MSDIAFPATSAPDPHGRAALLLVESLIHSLIDIDSLSIEGAVAVIEVARDAQLDLVDAERSPEAATELLEDILRSIQNDLPRNAPRR